MLDELLEIIAERILNRQSLTDVILKLTDTGIELTIKPIFTYSDVFEVKLTKDDGTNKMVTSLRVDKNHVQDFIYSDSKL